MSKRIIRVPDNWLAVTWAILREAFLHPFTKTIIVPTVRRLKP